MPPCRGDRAASDGGTGEIFIEAARRGPHRNPGQERENPGCRLRAVRVETGRDLDTSHRVIFAPLHIAVTGACAVAGFPSA
ncbi:hypothetical protein Mame01_06880 [Microbispora amethystogenes]|nr:hypothetical protein Mame01_06880 [Microbispora amethystogenes]